MYSNELLCEATQQSQLIEQEPVRGKSFTNHWRATLLCRTAAEQGQLLHPRVIQQVLSEGLSLPPGHQPGDYRRIRVYVNTADGPHHFPPPEQVVGLMQMWWGKIQEALLRGDPDLRQERVRWAFHAWFESLHPYPDFNGRVGRCTLWGTDMLAARELTTITFEARHQYYQRLGDWRAENPDWKQGQIRW